MQITLPYQYDIYKINTHYMHIVFVELFVSCWASKPKNYETHNAE